MWQRLILAVPIVLMPNALHFPLGTGIPAINLANALMIAVVLVLLMSPRRDGLGHTGTGMLTTPILLLFASLLIGLMIALHTLPRTLVGDLTELKNFMFYPLLYFVYRNCRQDLQGTRQLLALVLLVAILAGLESIWKGLYMDSFSSYNDGKRIAGPFGDYRVSNRAGVFYAMFLPMLVALVLYMRGQKLVRLVAIGGIAVLTVAILLTFSRQSYLIALVTCSLLLIRRHIVLAVLLGLATIPAIALLPEGVTQRVAETQQVDEVGDAQLDVSTASRFEIWSGAMSMWSDHPAGVGFDRFPSYIGQYSTYADYDAHNMYVLMLAECGPLGLLALLWLLWRMLRLALSVRRSSSPDDSEARAIGIGFTVSVIAMAMGNLYGSPFHEGLVMANFWILCGLVEHYAMLKHSAPAAATLTPAPSTGQLIGARFPLAAHIAPGRYRPDIK